MKKFVKAFLETIDLLWKMIGVTLLWYIPYKIITHYIWWFGFIILGIAIIIMFITIYKLED